MSDGYRVKLDAFEGPLDLLLHLVRTNEVDIYNLPIATITDQYLAYVDMFEELNLDVAGEYLVMAASLMYMKSRLLLPMDEDEEEEPEDSIEGLVKQLAEYQRYREAAEELRDRVLLDRDVFRRSPTPPEIEPEDDDRGMRPVELGDLFEALRKVLVRASARRPHTVEGEEYSVGDAVRSMVNRLRSADSVDFAELFDMESPRGWIVATFIGLLELVKLGAILAEQERNGGPICLRLVDGNLDGTIAALDSMYGAGAAAGLAQLASGEGNTDDEDASGEAQVPDVAPSDPDAGPTDGAATTDGADSGEDER